MSRNENASSKVATLNQMSQLLAMAIQSSPAIPQKRAQYFVEHPKEFKTALEQVFQDPAVEVLHSWEVFYKKTFGGHVLHFDDLCVPDPFMSFSRILVRFECITLADLFEVCKRLFKNTEIYHKWVNYPDLEITDISLRPHSNMMNIKRIRTYAARVSNFGAYEAYCHEQGLELKDRDYANITLAEGLLHYLKLFDETSNHGNGMMCSGSRDTDGRIPWFGYICEGTPRFYIGVPTNDSPLPPLGLVKL